MTDELDPQRLSTEGEGKVYTPEELAALPLITGGPPSRLCIDPKSPFYSQDCLARGVAVIFSGRERHDVYEYDVNAKWVKVLVRDKVTRDWAVSPRNGKPLTRMMFGEVRVSFRRQTA